MMGMNGGIIEGRQYKSSFNTGGNYFTGKINRERKKHSI